MAVELLAPAGSPEALDAAVGEGADAVYLGLKDFNARMRSANFAYSQFEGALRSLRRMGKKIYVTVNTVFEQREADRMYQLLKYLAAAGPDALIVQDFGVVAMARSCFPSLKLHASTQMNIASVGGVNALSRHGLSRVVLARELCLAELRSLRLETNMELEVFVHGALCVSASGLCLFSSYLGGKSANRGMCTQACRRLYRREGEGSAAPEEGYYFSPGDLQLLESLPDLAAAGINAVKIEGRMKSADYVGAVVSAYRLVLDAVESGDEEKIRQAIREGQAVLRGDFARAKTAFYFHASDMTSDITWLNPVQDGGTGISLGAIVQVKGSGDERLGLIRAEEGSLPGPGDTIRLHRRDDSRRLSHKLRFAGPEADGRWISIPEGFGPGDRVYLIQTKALSRRYDPVIARNSGGRGPGRDKAPWPDMPDRRGADIFPGGVYAAVSRLEDLYMIQSCRPVRVMLSLTRKNAAYLLADNKPPLPFKPAEIIISLDPYFPQALANTLGDEIQGLAEKGYRQFVLNNLGHFSLFRNAASKDLCSLIAGPWLYTFNAWALSFLASLGADGFVSPLENNRQNLERTLGAGGEDSSPRGNKNPRKPAKNQNPSRLRSRFFIPVFAWPSLFRIRADLGQVYDFDSFSDKQNEQFLLHSGPGGTLVFPEKPFSITDKIPFLREAGFDRFIIDLSGPAMKKADYRNVMCAVKEGAPLPGISRFNWKNGFYQNREPEHL
jgi:putative protease